MIQYLVILLDDTSTSFCHYSNNRKERNLMPLDILKAGIIYAMKENLNIQFVYPCYELPEEYLKVIDNIDHTNIQPSGNADNGDVIVLNGINDIKTSKYKKGVSYVLRIDKLSLFTQVEKVCKLLHQVDRLNIVMSDAETFKDEDTEAYNGVLKMLAATIESIYLNGKNVQCNLLTDRMMLDKMNNCGAGDTTITLAPNGMFYVCPAFYFADDEDAIGNLNYSIGDLKSGLDIKNSQLYKLDHAPLCRKCDAYQCKRCIWLNRKMTYEVNTPSHEQCVMAHLERNASRDLLQSIRRHGNFLPGHNINEIKYLDPFEVRKEKL